MKLSARHGRWVEILHGYTYSINHMFGVENKAADALTRRTCLLNQMSAQVVSFDKIKEKYESCADFGEILILLREEVTPEIDGFLFRDGYLFRFRKFTFHILS